MFKTYAVSDLLPGMLVVKVIEQSGPMKIRKVGMIRSPEMVKGLQEMGVTQVEVDLSQSLSVEFETPSDNEKLATNSLDNSNHHKPSDELLNEPISATPTQRLVASNKRIADADRQLSQQFHRSLFLPAVDQMPSKWSLYVRPYGVLAMTISLGLLIGFSVVSVPKYLMQSNETLVNIDTTEQHDNQNAEQSSITKTSNNTNNTPSSAIDTSPSPNSTSTDTTDVNIPVSNETTNTADTPSTLTDDDASINPAPAVEAEEQAPTQFVTQNGVIVESGQQVLGYQAPELVSPSNTASNTANNTPSNTATNTANNQDANNNDDDFTIDLTPTRPSSSVDSPVSNNELLRRAQEAALAIDSRPQSESIDNVKVTDFNDVPRIDQLSPAILTQMPAMSFSAHMYASNEIDRWVRVNNRRVAEGDYIAKDLMLKHIEPERVILSFRGDEFSMNALSDW